MKHSTTLFCLFLLASFTLSAQCENLTENCPEDLAFELKTGETDTVFTLTPPNTDQCGTANLFYTINGPLGAAGQGAPEAFSFQTGISELTYQYTESRFGNFTQEATPLPDGNGAEYTVPFMVSGMGQTVGGAGGLTRICFVMEHSYLGDLDIWISCPDGSTASLHEYSPNDDVQRQLLGQGTPYTDTPDPMGLYCWTVDAENTMAEHVSQFNVGSEQSMPTIDYLPVQSLSRFDSCQIAGEWALHIRDNLSNDNGSVSSAFVDFGTNSATPCVQEVKINQGVTPVRNLAALSLPLNAYPNPIADHFTVEVTSASAETGQLEVYAPIGALLFKQTAYLLPGKVSFQLSSADWPIGVYAVRITGGNQEGWVKVVKVAE